MSEYNTIVLEDGRARVFDNGNIQFLDELGRTTHRLGMYDVAELLRRACSSDSKALEVLARCMREGHRFTDDDVVIPLNGNRRGFEYDEEPF